MSGSSSLGRGVDHRGVEDRVQVQVGHLVGEVACQAEQQIRGLGDHLGDPGVGAVHLVDDDDHRQLGGQRLAQHEAGLRQGALGGVDEQDDAVDHRQAALHLAAEVRVAGRVDDVDVVGLVPALGRPFDAGRLGQDGDPAFLFEIVRIHRALFHALIVAEGAGLAEQLVDKRGLAMIDVGDDRHVAKGHRVLLSENDWRGP